jgi:hypothetical protein
MNETQRTEVLLQEHLGHAHGPKKVRGLCCHRSTSMGASMHVSSDRSHVARPATARSVSAQIYTAQRTTATITRYLEIYAAARTCCIPPRTPTRSAARAKNSRLSLRFMSAHHSMGALSCLWPHSMSGTVPYCGSADLEMIQYNTERLSIDCDARPTRNRLSRQTCFGPLCSYCDLRPASWLSRKSINS